MAEQKNFIVALILSCLVGQFGIDRLYLGYLGLGLLKLVIGLSGWFIFPPISFVWWIVDIIAIATGKMRAADGSALAR